MKKQWKVQGDPTAEFIYIDTLSTRDAVIYFANKYKDQILFKDFLKNNSDYKWVANELGITLSDIFMYYTYKLKINDLVNVMNEWEFSPSYGANEKEKKEMMKKKEKAMKEQLFYRPINVWKLLAYYCKYKSYSKAKSVLKEVQHLNFAVKKKGWTPILKKRFREIFTPMLFPKDNYKYADMLVCKVLKKEKKWVYKGELSASDIIESELFSKENFFNPECLVIINDKDASCERIDNILKDKKSPIVIGLRENPKRNIINNPLEIKEIKL